MHHLEQHISVIYNFPKQGIVFRDISPLFKNHFEELINELAKLFTEEELEKIDYLAGIEARGFAIAGALALRLGKGFIPIRKKGKLPPQVEQVSYELEYGTDALEMHYGAGNILLIDDVLATGGTLKAAANLCEKTGHNVYSILCIVDLAFLNTFEYKSLKAKSLFKYNTP